MNPAPEPRDDQQGAHEHASDTDSEICLERAAITPGDKIVDVTENSQNTSLTHRTRECQHLSEFVEWDSAEDRSAYSEF